VFTVFSVYLRAEINDESRGTGRRLKHTVDPFIADPIDPRRRRICDAGELVREADL